VLSAVLSLLHLNSPTEQERLAALKGRRAYARSGGCPYTTPHLIRAWKEGWNAELDNSEAVDPDWDLGTWGTQPNTDRTPAS